MRRTVPVLLSVYGCVAGILTLVLLVSHFREIPIGNLTRDPAGTLHFPFYYGAISHAGILLWCATATMCLFSVLALRRHATGASLERFFLASTAVTLMLLFDDLFLFHETVFPHYLGIPELVTYIAYVLAIGSYVVVFRRTLMKAEFLLLLSAGVFLGSSIIADRIFLAFGSAETGTMYFIEDGLKLVGIACWAAFFARLSLHQVRSSLSTTTN